MKDKNLTPTNDQTQQADGDPELMILKDEEAIVLDHDYDGIKELDNNLPNWWLWTFFGAIIFSFIYTLHYGTKSGPTLREELAADLAAIEKLQKTSSAQGPQIAAAHISEALKDPSRVGSGKGVFTGKCAACHGQNGEGGIGPNLTDDFWINGDGKPETIAKIVRDGTPAGMPPWGAILQQDEMVNVSAFVASIRGSRPANAKAPQGNKIQ
jgi:cytochrome c oxidase cbb3-type subunit 3